jgi:transposase
MQYIGVDHHKRSSYITVMDERGKIVKEGRVANNRESLRRFLNNPHSCGDSSAVLEAGRNWTVMYDWLEEEVGEVKLAHPVKVKAIAEAKIKTDRIDSKVLAHLLRCDLLPEAYVPGKDARLAKNILRQRMFFIKVLTMVKNRIHMILDRHPEIRNQIDPADLFGAQGKRWMTEVELPKEDRRLLDSELKLLDALEERIKASNSWVSSLGSGDRRVKRLMSIPGIGKFFALLIATEIDDIRRFRNADKLAAYVGLIPSTYSSANMTFHGRITKQGNKYLRWALIEAVWPAIRKDLGLRMYYQKMKARKGANPAKVATARRLLMIVYRVLFQDRDYMPGRPHLSLTEATV